jgi:hypothetical protein
LDVLFFFLFLKIKKRTVESTKKKKYYLAVGRQDDRTEMLNVVRHVGAEEVLLGRHGALALGRRRRYLNKNDRYEKKKKNPIFGFFWSNTSPAGRPKPGQRRIFLLPSPGECDLCRVCVRACARVGMRVCLVC